MSVLANSAVIGGDVNTGDIGHSLRFRSAASAYLSRTPGAGSTTAWALSLWVKRGAIGSEQSLFAATSAGTNYSIFEFNASDQLYFVNRPSGGVNVSLTTTRVFRDPTSFIHLFLVYDSANATQTDRVRLEVNGVRETSFSSPTWPTSSLASIIETAIVHYIGNAGLGAFADQYMARIAFITGNGSLSASSVGYLNTEINEWVSKSQSQVKAVVDAGGANSFMLEFKDATSLTTLGYDLHGANLLTYSQDFTNATWSKPGCTVTPDAVTAPDSTLTADTVLFSAPADFTYQALTSNVSVYHTASIYIKAITASSILLALAFSTGGAYNNCSVDFNPATGVLGTPSSYGGAIISGATATALSNGWWRISLTGKSSDPANTSVAHQLYCLSSAYSCYVWGAQLERGTTASPYKATTSSALPHNDWTLNNFSLTAGSTYDHMLDVPGNSYATLNPLIPSAANITNGNLSSGTTAARATMNSTAFDSQWFVTAGASAVTAGVIDDAGTTNTTTVTANKVFAFKMTATGSLSYKNVTDAGSWTSISTGLTGNRWPYSVTQVASWNFGQQPLPEALDTGFKALCQANLSDSGTVIVSGSFTGNVSADGPCIWMNGTPKTLTINSNAVTFGTHADRLATGFKIRTASTSYNSTGTNTWTATIDSNLQNIFKYNNG